MIKCNVGFLPELGGGLQSLARAGQHGRLLNYYCRPYLQHFQRIYYFSYYDEVLAEYTQAPDLLAGVTLVPKVGLLRPKPYSLTMALHHRPAFRQCSVLRVFQATGVLPAIAAQQLYRIPFVTTYGYPYAIVARESGLPAWKVALYALLERLAFRFANGVIVTTEHLREYVGQWVPAERVHVVPNGVDTEVFCPAPQKTSTGNRNTVMFVGRLERDKDLPILLTAGSLLGGKGQPVTLRLVGAGSLREALEHQARDFGLDAHFLGTIRHHQLPDLLQHADVFVLPSPREGHPKALIEAMSCGLPCVVSDCDGNRSLVKDGENGLLFPVGDAQTLANKMRRVLDNPVLARRLGERARQTIVAQFDIRTLLEREVSILRELAESREASCRGTTRSPGGRT